MRARQRAAALLLAIVGVAGPPADADPIEDAQRGRALLQDGRFEDAAAALEQACAGLTAAYGEWHPYRAFCLTDQSQAELGRGQGLRALELANTAQRIIREAMPGGIEEAVVEATRGGALARLGRIGEAEAPLRWAYDRLREVEGPRGVRTIQAARNLASVLLELRRPAEARAFYDAALAGAEGDALPAEIRAERVGALLELGELGEAERDATLALTTADRAGAATATRATVRIAAARVATARSDLSRAQDLLQEALDLVAAGPTILRAQALYVLGNVQILRREAVEAEATYRQVAELYRRELGEEHPAMARLAHQLALVYTVLGRDDDSRRFFEQAIALAAKTLGETSLPVAETRTEYALSLAEAGMSDEAVRQAQAARVIFDRLGNPPPLRRAFASSALGFALKAAGRPREAAAAFVEATEAMAAIDGPRSVHLPPGLMALAELDLAAGEQARARARLERARDILDAVGARTVEGLARALDLQARLEMTDGRPEAALRAARLAVQVAEERLRLAASGLGIAGRSEQRAARRIVEGYLALAAPRAGDPEVVREMVEVAQLPLLSGTALAVSRMAARVAGGEGRLAGLVRERERAGEDYHIRDQLLTDAMAAGRSSRAAALRAELAELAERIGQFDAEIAAGFPAYAELTRPRPAPLDILQDALGSDEGMWLQISDPVGTTVLLVSREGASATRTDLTRAQLTELVGRLRGDLRPEAIPPDFATRPGSFDTEAAARLYAGLLAPFAPRLERVRHLIMVPDGALQSLPPAVLLRSRPAMPPATYADLAGLDWLIRQHALTILPSASALISLRRLAPTSDAPEPFLGFGDPDFQGSGSSRQRGASLDSVLTREGDVDLSKLRASLVPLPETREELAEIARMLGARKDALMLGAEASETNVKRAELDRYRTLAFATHGLLAAETQLFAALSEPSLALSPPQNASAKDDGLLTASEIAALNLDADWVLLSACNTASDSGEEGAEGLSGLARAFFYAGSRALLVTHWAVETTTAQMLTTRTMWAFAQPGRPSRAEALRSSMLTLLDSPPEPWMAHPYFWAPFVVVGEGGGQSM